MNFFCIFTDYWKSGLENALGWGIEFFEMEVEPMLAIILVVVGLFGMIGNTITISILNRRDMKTPNNFILKGR